MCGIVAVIGPAVGGELKQLVSRMNSRLEHRGPDEGGEWAVDGFAFAMRRLAIVDLAGGQQPIVSDDGVGLVFNGEIYNFRELRAELVADGFRFRTESDTEVLLQLYRRDGIECLHRLNGMFAFCLRDERRGVVHLVRDRVGIKPLYYGRDDGNFLAASELKALLSGFRTRPSLNRRALASYLAYRFVPSPETIWEGIEKVPPGHRIEIPTAGGESRSVQWWAAAFLADPTEAGRDYETEFETYFLSAVESRIVTADVPVGIMLSGGLDSSALAAAAAELGHRELNSFSVGFSDGGQYSELGFARDVARHVGTRHHEVILDESTFMDTLPDVTYHMDEPLADLATVPLLAVSRLAHEHVTVALSGEGADELLLGYDLERKAAWLQRQARLNRVPRPLLRMARRTLDAFGRGGGLALLADNGWSELFRGRRLHMTNYRTAEEVGALLGSDELGHHPGSELDTWYGEESSDHPLDQWQGVHFRQWLVEDLLMKADKMSMATSLELRVPFLDHGLVEWGARLSHEWKVGTSRIGWSSKRILRRFAQRRLPASIIDRPKQGFPVPVYDWLQGELGERLERRWLRSDNPLIDYLDVTEGAKAFEKARTGDQRAAHQAWSLTVLDYWAEHWL